MPLKDHGLEPAIQKTVPGEEDGTSSLSMDGIGPFTSLRLRNFRLLFVGTLLTNAAQWIQSVTLSWLVYNLTGSGVMLGYMSLVRSVGSLGMVPVAGVLIDRLDRRKLMLLTNGWLFIITLTLGLILISGNRHISFLFIFAVLGGLTQTVDTTLRQVLVFSLVPRSLTPNALALIQTGWGLMRSFGPGIGGFLILWFGPGGNFLIQAGAYALIAFNIMQIHFQSSRTDITGNSPFQNIREGVQYIAKEPLTRTFMLLGLVLPLFVVPVFTVLAPIYAQDVFHGGPETLGLLLASLGFGGITGGLVSAALTRVERRGMVQVAALFLLGISLVGFALCTQFWSALIAMVSVGFFEMVFIITNQTILQLSIPNNMRGRVTSIVNLNAALWPLGGLVAGFGSDFFGGPRTITMILGGLGAVVALCVFQFSSTVRNYSMSRAIAANSNSSTGDRHSLP
jgi:MFS family permease